MTENGFVKFPRKMAEREWFGDGSTLIVYVFLLCHASFADMEYAGRTLRKGQYITSLRQLSQKTRLSFQQIRTALKHLEATHDITIETGTKYSIITVKNVTEDNCSDTCVNTRANTSVNTQPHTISRSKEDIKEEDNKEEVSAASPPSPSPSENNDLSFSGPAADERQALVKTYGESAVAMYEKKFREWASKKRADNVPMYPTVAKWLAQDIGTKPRGGAAPAQNSRRNSSLDIERIMAAVMDSYKK